MKALRNLLISLVILALIMAIVLHFNWAYVLVIILALLACKIQYEILIEEEENTNLFN